MLGQIGACKICLGYTLEQGKNRDKGMHVIFDFFSNF